MKQMIAITVRQRLTIALAFVVEAEDVHARVFLAAPVQVPHMDER